MNLENAAHHAKKAFDLQPELEDERIILRPLRHDDFEALYRVASDPLIWEQHPAKDRCQRDVFRGFFDEALHTSAAFVVLDRRNNQIIGSTRYNPVQGHSNAIEIGWTFLARQYWGGWYNQSMKRLLIDHAFQFVGHVLFFIHENNMRSRKAVEKLGAVLITTLDGKILETRTNATVVYLLDDLSWKASGINGREK